uniref:Wsv011-like protein n=1 Tax=Sicyonia whispovirus TaxID=2984283 RepID=A0A9C7BJ28_9VIRU|nr:MAG: wsv011-like protein [Sicyonia whispovirus]
MHASRGAHLNLVDSASPSGVVSYKIVDFSCTDKPIRWPKRASHPFTEKIDATLQSHPDFGRGAGGFVISDTGEKFTNMAWGPVCGERDAMISDCCLWATFDNPNYFQPWVADIRLLRQGLSLSCDERLTVLGSVATVVLSLGRDVAEKIFKVTEEAVLGAGSRKFRALTGSPSFLFGLPMVPGALAAHFRPENWKTGLGVALVALVVLTLVCFLTIAGTHTLNLFAAGDTVKRRFSETFEKMSPAPCLSASCLLTDAVGDRTKMVALPSPLPLTGQPPTVSSGGGGGCCPRAACRRAPYSSPPPPTTPAQLRSSAF